MIHYQLHSHLIIADHLDHGEEAIGILLVAVASVEPGQQKVEGVSKLLTGPRPDLKVDQVRAIFLSEGGQAWLKEIYDNSNQY